MELDYEVDVAGREDATRVAELLCEDDPHALAVWHARHLLDALGLPCNEEDTAGVPERFVAALEELTDGLREDPGRHLARLFPPPDTQ